MTQRTALVSPDGVIRHIVVVGPGWDPPDGLRAIPTNTANLGDRHDGQHFVPADEPILSAEMLMSHARRRRSIVARVGFTFDVASAAPAQIVRISTTEERRADLADLAHLAEQDPSFIATWTDDWGSARLSAAKILELRRKMAEHVARTYESLDRALSGIRSGAATKRSHIDEAMMPHE